MLPETSKPKSVTHFGLNLVPVAVVLGVMYLLRSHAWVVEDPVLLVCAAFVLPLVILEMGVLRVHRRETTGLDWDRNFAPSKTRVATKLLGLAVTLAPFALAYWVFPEYRGSFYDPFYNLLLRFGPILIPVTVLYFYFVDGKLRKPNDVYWQLGRVALGRWSDCNRGEIGNHYRGWLVKSYFFALFWVWLSNSFSNVLNADLSTASVSNLRLYEFGYDFIFFIDLLIATIGYAMTYRVLDTHIRSAEPTLLGWVVALSSYEPFFSGLMQPHYLNYGGVSFGAWLEPHPTLRWAWAGVIVILILIYLSATIAFGGRFSNLTHRGIITGGPYRFSKHPAYLAKNLSWWLSSVPFVINDSLANAIRRCILLILVNLIYFLRARTEERHLSMDPTYVDYALWIDRHGALRFLNRIPFFRYRKPVDPTHPTRQGMPSIF